MSGISKKKKQMLKKLGCDHVVDSYKKNEANMKATLKEVMSEPPSYVCGRVISSHKLTITMNGQEMRLSPGDEMMMPLGFFLQNKEMTDKKTKQTMQIMKPATKTFLERFRRYNGQDLSNKTLLIWRFGGIGDIMFCQPLVKHIKKTFPNSKVVFATAPNNKGVFSFWPSGLVDDVTDIPFNSKFMDEADYHLTFEGSIERCKEAHEINCYDIFAKVAGLEFNPKDYPLEAFPDPNIVDSLRPYIPPKTIAFQMRASSNLRTMPLTKSIEIINALTDLGFTVGIIDSSREEKIVQSVIDQCPLKRKERVINLAKLSKSLNHCVSILKLCCGSVSTDSSVTHLANAVGIPSIGIYGPFRGELRMLYYDNADWVNGSDGWNECGRAPCYAHDAQAHLCPYMQKKQFVGCLQCIDVDKLVDKFVNIYSKFEK
jgi:ADP-heptose:LPS heptosyltransferase